MLLPGLARGMAGGHMADLVGQDGGKLVLIVQIGEHSAGHIDVASGKRHGIDDRTIENGEGDRRIAKFFSRSGAPEVTGGENSVADLRDVAL